MMFNSRLVLPLLASLGRYSQIGPPQPINIPAFFKCHKNLWKHLYGLVRSFFPLSCYARGNKWITSRRYKHLSISFFLSLDLSFFPFLSVSHSLYLPYILLSIYLSINLSIHIFNHHLHI